MSESRTASGQAGSPPKATDRWRPQNFRLLIPFLAAAAVGTVGFYTLTFFLTGGWQILAYGGCVLLATASLVVARRFIRQQALDAAGIWIMLGMAFAYGTGILFLSGVTTYLAIGGALLVMLLGTLLLPRHWWLWLVTGGTYLALTLVLDRFPILERYDANQSGLLKVFVIAITVILGLLFVWQLARAFFIGNIRTRLLISFLTIVLVPVAAIIGGSVLFGLENGRRQALNQLDAVATLKQAEIEDWTFFLQGYLLLTFHEHEAIAIQENLILGVPGTESYRLTHADLQADMRNLIAQTGLYESLFVMDGQGWVILSTDEAQEGKNYAREEFFEQGLKGPYTGPPSYYPSLGRMALHISRPLVDSAGQVFGVLAARSNLVKLNAIMREHTGLGETTETYLVGANHALLTESRFAEANSYPRTVGANAAIDRKQDGHGEYLSANGVPVVGAYRWIPNLRVALLVEQEQAEAYGPAYASLNTNIIIALVAAAAAIGLALFITASIATPLSNLTKTATQIAAGDLEQTARVERDDEVGTLAGAFNKMTGRLREMIGSLEQRNQRLQSTVERYVALMDEIAQGNLAARVTLDGDFRDGDPLVVLGHNLNQMAHSLQQVTAQIQSAAGDLSAASSEILASTTQQAAGANEQSAAISQTVATVEELRTLSEQNTQRASGVVAMNQRTAEVSRLGQEAVAGTIAGMQEIKQKVELIAQNILALSEQAQAIGQIISTVSEIAAQSNMLALNAAVEAARAGDAGRGFAVVAGEVRSLADQSRAATVQIRDILTEIQRGVNTAVMATEEGMKGSDAGVRLADRAGTAIRQLAESVIESAQAAEQIAAAANQQLSGIEQIALAMQNIHQVTLQSVAGARQSERAAEDLNRLAQQLRQTVQRYRLQ